MNRPRGSVYIAATLDGYIARPDGGLDWLEAMQSPGEDYGYAEFFASVDGLVIGRGTWDVARGFSSWPYDGKTVVVLTSRPEPPTHGEKLVQGDLRELLPRLHADGLRHVYYDGANVIRQALGAGVVDELVLSVVPRLLGSGIRLFEPGLPDVPLRLESSRAFSTGLVQLRYTPS